MAQDNFRCYPVPSQNQLTNNYIECIFTDSYGFTWIGTWNGLNRYDGFEFKHYTPTISEKSKFIGNWIFDLKEDNNKNIWIATNYGLFVYNRKIDKIDYVKSFGGSIFSIEITDNGLMWAGTDKGLLLFNIENRTIVNDFKKANTEFPLEIADIAIDKQNNLWLGTRKNGFVCFNTSREKFHYFNKNNTEIRISIPTVHSVAFDLDSNFWIGSMGGGAYKLDTVSGKLTNYKHNPDNNKSIGSNDVYSICIDSLNNDVWLSCINGYLNKITKDNEIVRFEYNPRKPEDFHTVSVSYLQPDGNGNYWIGTHGQGLFLYNKTTNKITSNILTVGLTNKSFTQVTGFAEIDSVTIAIGTDGNGIWEYNTKDGFVRNVKKGFSSLAILSLLKDTLTGNIWATTWGGGIIELNKKLEIQNILRMNTETKQGLTADDSKSLFINNEKVIISTHGFGYCTFNKKTKLFEPTKNMKVPVWNNSVIKDKRNRTWFACYGGVYKFENDSITHYSNTESNEKLSSNSVLVVFEDNRNGIWALTELGVDYYNETTQTFEHILCQDDIHVTFKSIVQDDNGLFWIGTDKGIYSYDFNQKKIIKNINKHDGLVGNNCIQNALFKASDGTIFIGLDNGFSFFHPDSLIESKEKPEIFIVDYFINNVLQITIQGTEHPKHIQSSDSLVLDYSRNTISIKFSGNKIVIPENISYRYMLKGFNDNWINLDKERIISLTNIPPGSYKLIIEGRSKSGYIGNNFNGLTIVIKPLWWQSWWFYSINVIILILIVLFILKIRTYRIRIENERLENLIKERTSELFLANTKLSEQKEELKSSNEHLSANQKIIQSKNKELNESIQTKDKLISIIAHDLKNPMSAILGLAELLKNKAETIEREKIERISTSIYKSSISILDQMVTLLDWARSQTNNIYYSPECFNINDIIKDTVSFLEETAKNKEIELVIKNYTQEKAYADPRMTATVIRNLINNAIKFTPKMGKITIHSIVYYDELQITITDTGIGIAPEIAETIFDSATNNTTYGTENEKGTGLGLKICKDFVEKNKGQISVTSVLDKGTSFTFTLPVCKQ
ncbi:MAG: hypothetical protein IPO21_10395 [Bacteroidales bacterium]|nr:hypothetical protein [Bacteroidales bacterium]